MATNFGDVIYDSKGNDYIDSGAGDDVIYLTDGEDFVNAGEGDDIIYLLGHGEKRIWGGPGKDTYVITPNFASNKNTIILDFSPTVDKIDLTNFQNITSIDDLKLTDVIEKDLNFTMLIISSNKELALFGVQANEITNYAFVF